MDAKTLEEKRELQKQKARMEVSKITTKLPGTPPDKNDIQYDEDVKIHLKTDIMYGTGKLITPEQQENRMSAIIEMLLRAYTEREIISWGRNQFKMSNEDTKALYQKAKKQISEPWRKHFPEEQDWHVMVRKKMLKNNISKQGDDKLSLLILDSIAKVQGIYDTKPVIEPTDTEFDKAEESLDKHDDVIESIMSGDGSALKEFEENYRNKDKRGLEHEDDDGDVEDGDTDNEQDEE